MNHTKYDKLAQMQAHKVEELAVDIDGREHHSSWCQTINHPDAHLIAAAPEMYNQLSEVSNWLNSQLGMGDWHKEIEQLLAKARGGK